MGSIASAKSAMHYQGISLSAQRCSSCMHSVELARGWRCNLGGFLVGSVSGCERWATPPRPTPAVDVQESTL